MTTVAELCAQTPDPTYGVPTQIGDGNWRWVVEIADPGVGASVEWHDVSCYCAGYEAIRGTTLFLGRYEAMTVNLLLVTTDDRLAPWNENTASTFGGTHVDLGAGLLIRSSIIHLSGGAVNTWYPRFTCRVEAWTDSTAHEGMTRVHEIFARDAFTDLVDTPVSGGAGGGWGARVDTVLSDADWPFGRLRYGALAPVTLPAYEENYSAVALLDSTCDPSGIIWYTDRRGRLVFRPMIGDSIHGATNPIPAKADTIFSYRACDDGQIAYAISEGSIYDRFGFDDAEEPILNKLVVNDPVTPVATFDEPLSIQRYGVHGRTAAWEVASNTVAQDMLDIRAFATKQARPLTSTIDLDGFFPRMARLEYLDPVVIRHKTAEGRSLVTGTGFVRQLTERVGPRVPNKSITWEIDVTADIITTASSDDNLLPVLPPGGGTVGGIECAGSTATSLDWAWTNPTGQPVTPTHTQVRLSPSQVWIDLDYPMTGISWEGLDPDRDYRLDVRLIRRDSSDLITHASPTMTQICRTDEATSPTQPGLPGGGDSGGGYVPPSGIDPDSGAGCSLIYEVQESDDNAATWTSVYEGGNPAGDDNPFDIGDVITPTDTYLYRVRVRDSCADNTGGAAWSDWSAPGYYMGDTGECLGQPPAAFPYTDASLSLYVPLLCPGNVIREFVEGKEVSYGPQFPGWDPAIGDVPFFDGEKVWVSSVETNGPTIYGTSEAAANMIGSQQHVMTIQFGSTIDYTRPLKLYSVGPFFFSLASPGDYLSAVIYGRTAPIIAASSIVPQAGQTYVLAAQYDATTGVLDFYVNGNLEATDTSSDEPEDGTYQLEDSSGDWAIDILSGSRVTDVASWDAIPVEAGVDSFCDDFARAPGVVGANWEVPTAFPTSAGIEGVTGANEPVISDGAVDGYFDPGNTRVHEMAYWVGTVPTDADTIYADAVVNITAEDVSEYATFYMYLGINALDDFTGISSEIITNSDGFRQRFRIYAAGSFVDLSGDHFNYGGTGTYTVRAEVDRTGVARFYVNGALVNEYDFATAVTGTRVGFSGRNTGATPIALDSICFGFSGFDTGGGGGPYPTGNVGGPGATETLAPPLPMSVDTEWSGITGSRATWNWAWVAGADAIQWQKVGSGASYDPDWTDGAGIPTTSLYTLAAEPDGQVVWNFEAQGESTTWYARSVRREAGVVVEYSRVVAVTYIPASGP